jgi:hypothetical protein
VHRRRRDPGARQIHAQSQSGGRRPLISFYLVLFFPLGRGVMGGGNRWGGWDEKSSRDAVVAVATLRSGTKLNQNQIRADPIPFSLIEERGEPRKLGTEGAGAETVGWGHRRRWRPSKGCFLG